MKDFTPIFSSINEWNELEALIDLTIGVNQIMNNLKNEFTIDSLFGKSLLKIFEIYFDVQFNNQFQQATINFPKVFKIVKLSLNY